MNSPVFSQPACLLLHGYGGTPFDLERIAGALEAAGFAVRLPCLAGHGEGEDFAAFRFPDWLAHAEREFAQLAAKHEKVAVVGFSMGGTLALNLAARFPVVGVVTLSAPVYILQFFPWPWVHTRLYASSAVTQLGKMAAAWKKTSAAKETSRDIAPWKGYAGPINIPQLYSFRRGCAATRKLLPAITAPLLALHDAKDSIVYAGNACEIARRVSSRVNTVTYTRIAETVTRHHLIVTHRETADFVTGETVRFCRMVCGQG